MPGRLSQKWFDAIANGTKTVEGRMEGNKTWQVGDKVIFSCDDQHLTVEITYVMPYSTIADMVAAEGAVHLTPGHTPEESEDIYARIYAPCKDGKKRIVAYGLRLITK